MSYLKFKRIVRAYFYEEGGNKYLKRRLRRKSLTFARLHLNYYECYFMFMGETKCVGFNTKASSCPWELIGKTEKKIGNSIKEVCDHLWRTPYENKIINFKGENLIRPTRSHYNDAGIDCYAHGTYTIEPRSSVTIPLGFGLELPDGMVATLLPRSSMNAKDILTQTGTIDAGYRGEIKAILHNLNHYAIHIAHGDKICQIVVQPVIDVDLVDELKNDRGQNGFGSTGG